MNTGVVKLEEIQGITDSNTDDSGKNGEEENVEQEGWTRLMCLASESG